MNIYFSFVSILGLALRLRHEFTTVSTLVLQIFSSIIANFVKIIFSFIKSYEVTVTKLH